MLTEPQIIGKKRVAEFCDSEKQRCYLRAHHCEIWTKKEVVAVVVKASKTVDPMSLPELKAAASSLLGMEPIVSLKLEEMTSDATVRTKLLGHLTDAAIAHCLKECYVNLD